MKRWIFEVPKDKRIKPFAEKKSMKSLRLSLNARNILKDKARGLNLSESEYLEKIICGGS